MGYTVPPANAFLKNVGFATQYFVAARSHTNGMLPCCSLSCLQLQRFANNEYAAQYFVELAFSLARVRICTLPSGKPRSSCLACSLHRFANGEVAEIF